MRRLVLFEPTRLMREGLARLLVEVGYELVYQDSYLDPEHTGASDSSVDLVLTELPDADCGMVRWIERLSTCYPNARIVVLTNHSDDPERLAEAFGQGAAGYLAKNSSFEAMQAALDAVLNGQVVYPRSLREGLVRASASHPPTNGVAASVRSAAAQRSAEQTRSATGDTASIGAGRNGHDSGPSHRALNGGGHAAGHERIWQSTAIPPAPAAPSTNGHHAGSSAAGTRHAALPPHGASVPGLHPTRANGDVADEWLRHKGLSDREAEILRYVATGDANKVIANRLEISEATVKSHIKSLLRKLDFQNRTQAAVWAHSHAADLLNGSRRAAE